MDGYRGVIRKAWDSSVLISWNWQAFRKFSVWAETAELQPSHSLIPHFLWTFLYHLFWSVLLPFWGSSTGLSFISSTSALRVSAPQALFSALWISLSTPTSSFTTFFQWSHPFSKLSSLFSESQVYLSQIPWLLKYLPWICKFLRWLSSLLLKLICLNPNTLPFYKLFLHPHFLNLS